MVLIPQMNLTHLYASALITATFEDSYGAVGGTKTGTASMITGLGSEDYYFITNRHIADYNYEIDPDKRVPGATLKSIRISGNFQPDDLTAAPLWWQAESSHPEFKFAEPYEVDLAILKVEIGNSEGKLQVRAERPELGWALNRLQIDQFATTSELNSVQPGDAIRIAGYPGIGEIDLVRPLLISGIVSSDPRYPATFMNVVRPHSVFAHSFSWGGMSGAPVYGYSDAVGTPKILGVNVGHIADEGVSGGVISHFIRSDAVLDLLARMVEPVSPDSIAP